jgi:hypothetical protein
VAAGSETAAAFFACSLPDSDKLAAVGESVAFFDKTLWSIPI